jgi:hypothetical protein
MRSALTTVSSAAFRVTNDDDSTAAGKSMSDGQQFNVVGSEGD